MVNLYLWDPYFIKRFTINQTHNSYSLTKAVWNSFFSILVCLGIKTDFYVRVKVLNWNKVHFTASVKYIWIYIIFSCVTIYKISYGIFVTRIPQTSVEKWRFVTCLYIGKRNIILMSQCWNNYHTFGHMKLDFDKQTLSH